MGDKQGFSTLQISDDTFEVTAQGGYHVSGQLVRKYFLCKAAEVTIEHGGRYFMILRDERDKSKGIDILDPETNPKSVLAGQLPAPYRSALPDTDAYDGSIKYSNTGTIRVLTEIPPEGEYYDAELISKKMSPKIQKGLRNEDRVSTFRTVFKLMDVFKKTL